MFNFVFDRRNDNRPYPNLAPMMDNPHESYHGMGDTYPYIVPCRLLYFCQDHNYPVNVYYIDEIFPANSLYPVGLGWFDYSQDYFAMMSDQVIQQISAGNLTVLFYYHEGDNPYYEKERLDQLCREHNLPTTCYKFVSGNTQADNIPGFVFFPDHELFYWRNGVVWNNIPQDGATAHTNIRNKKFTLLSRIHKWWRGTIVSYLRQQNLLNHAYWSYNNISIGDRPEDNPIQIDRFTELRQYLDKFLQNAPYTCDQLTADEHNSHWILAKYLYEDSYCSFVLETLYDAEQSGGAFITEKTFKAIRNAHPFIIFGCPGSLATLRQLGYRTFDAFIDNTYDDEQDNTKRFVKTIDAVKKLLDQDLHSWYQSCLEDITYNQNLLLSSKYSRLDELRVNLNSV
jgi:hypothetical protein